MVGRQDRRARASLEGGLVMSLVAVTTSVGLRMPGSSGTMPAPSWYACSASSCCLIEPTSALSGGITLLSCSPGGNPCPS